MPVPKRKIKKFRESERDQLNIRLRPGERQKLVKLAVKHQSKTSRTISLPEFAGLLLFPEREPRVSA